MIFQALSWHTEDIVDDDEYDDDDSSDEVPMNNDIFTISIFGKDQNGDSVCVHVTDYRPCVSVKFPESVSSLLNYYDILELFGKQLIKWSKTEEGFEKDFDASNCILEAEDDPISLKKSIWGISMTDSEPIFKFYFQTIFAYKKIRYLIESCKENTMSIDEMEHFYEEFSEIPEYESQLQYISSVAKHYNVSEQCLKWMTKLGRSKLSFEFAKGQLFDTIDPLLKFAHETGIKMSSWIQFKDTEEAYVPETLRSTSKLEYTTSYKNIAMYESDSICPLKEMAFDIETYSSITGKFSDEFNEKDCVYQIGITLKFYTDKVAKRVLLHYSQNGLAPCNKVPMVSACIRGQFENSIELCQNKECMKSGHVITEIEPIIINCLTERDLLLKFKEIIITEDPDIIYAYNSDKFDWSYVMCRAQVTQCSMEFNKMSRLIDYQCKIEEKRFQSAAYGDNTFKIVAIPGRLNIDLMIWIQRNMPVDRYNDYKLDTIAQLEINQQKFDVSYDSMFKAFKDKDIDFLTKVGDYCLQDTILVQKLVCKLDVLTQLFEMSNLTYVPCSYLLSKGQQIKVFSIISKDAMHKDFCVPLKGVRDPGSFRGAIVLPSKSGYYNTPVAVLDFASLYPSIQIAKKICYTTIVLDPVLHEQLLRLKNEQSSSSKQDLEINGIIFDFVEWDDTVIQYIDNDGIVSLFSNEDDAKEATKISRKIICQVLDGKTNLPNVSFNWITRHYLFFFAQNTTSIIPDLQMKLKAARKAVKRKMAEIENSTNPEDQLRYRVLNGRQLALKVTMNSIYGFTSAFTLNLGALAACVTGRGRQMIDMTKNFMEKEFESIAKTNYWTKKDTITWYTDKMKEVISETSDLGWVRKFPSAVEGELWTCKPLMIDVVGGDTGNNFEFYLIFFLDSVFCNFPNSTLDEAISLNHKAEEILTDIIFDCKNTQIVMEYEKSYMPMVIIKKKNYIGCKYEMDRYRFKVDYKGIALKRRNYCKTVKDIYWNMVHPSLGIEKGPNGKLQKVSWNYTEGPDRAIQSLSDSLAVLLLKENNSTLVRDDYNDFCISASLKSEYKSDNLPHVQLAKRMKERDESSAPVSGSRFLYVIINEDNRTDVLSAKSEDPQFAFDHGLAIDYIFYLENQIRKPIMKFMNLLGKWHEANAIFEETLNNLFMNKVHQRIKSEMTARELFVNSGIVNQVSKLKRPRNSLSSAEKKKKMTNGMKQLFID
jgi:DNA polymerase elongation subunit (family B)